MFKLKKIGSSQKPLKITVLGARQSGKTTFFTVAYHNKSNDKGHRIIPADPYTREKARKKQNELKNDKIKPTTIGKKEKYSFKFLKNGKENGHELHFDWLDIAGEYCDFDSERSGVTDDDKEFDEFVKDSDGCCIIIDSKKLLEDKFNCDNMEYLCQHISDVRKSRRKLKINRYKYPLVIVYTKVDLLEGKENLTELLIEKSKHLLNQTSGDAYERKMFTSQLIRKENEISSKGQLEAMVWLINQAQKNCGIFSALIDLSKHPIKSFSTE